MLYTNQSGEILIDEDAMSLDISKMNSAKNRLSDAMNLLDNMLHVNSSMAGLASEDMNKVMIGLLKKFNSLSEYMDSNAAYMKKVIAAYEAKDRELKNKIDGSF